MRTRYFVLLNLIFLGLALTASAETPKFQSMEQYTRIQIPAAAGSSFRLINGTGTEVSVVVDRVKPGSLAQAPNWQDARVKSVQVQSLGIDKVEMKVSFGQSGIESFAYMQGDTLVVDLWKGAETKSEAKAEPKSSTKLAANLPARLPDQVKANSHSTGKAGPAKSNVKSKGERKLASADGPNAHAHSSVIAPVIAPVQPLQMGRDLFQRFVLPMPELKLSAEKGGLILPPAGDIDGLWTFTKSKEESGRSFEFAKKLFEEKKYGLAVKTVEIVRRDEPKSPHLDELEYLEALCYRKLGESTHTEALVTRSERMFEELGARRDATGTPLPFHGVIRLYFAEKEYNKGNWLQAISHLEFVNGVLAPDDPKLPYVQMMLAEAYVKVDQPRRAERLYRFVFERYPQHVAAKESRYRIADLLALERNYNRITEEGEGAIEAYPDYEKKRAEVLFQMGEANFWLGNLARAEKYFRRFTEISPSQTNAALAWVRLGEIRELARSDIEGARQAYLKAKNGYPFSQGDLVASVRLARIDLPQEKEPGFVVKSLSEMLADKTIDGDLKRMAELTLADYLLVTGEVDRSIGVARDGMAQTQGKAYEGFKLVYMRSLFAKLQGLNREKKFGEALALYDRERQWFDLHGAESFRALSETYRGLGLFATANELMEKYQRETKGGRGLASRARDEALALTKAKNSFARGAYAEVLANMPTEDVSAEAVAMQAVSEFRLGRKREAYKSAERALGVGAELSDSSLGDLAEILIDRDMAERDFPRMEVEVAKIRKRLEKDDERLAFAAGDALWYQKKHTEAIASYRAALEGFPKAAKERAERARYNMGMSLVSLGQHEEAVKQLTQLRDSGQSVWSESAKQELELMTWEKKYSSVLRTLPPSGLGISN